jgi:hypothetical protein
LTLLTCFTITKHDYIFDTYIADTVISNHIYNNQLIGIKSSISDIINYNRTININSVIKIGYSIIEKDTCMVSENIN